ncbi:SLAM family member 5-like [Neolamprologus brichardi]|uniref:SLAM family member 5-like n=1 Tax=Neolamprologus brichardi TaxID=32507 RepID=UPI0003EC44AD|nr:SLAM family member 5-like [Neolamprologus brichardi]
MTRGVVLFALFLFYIIEIQGLQPVFLLHGKDLYLDINEPVKLEEETNVFWNFNSSNTIAKCDFNKDQFVYKKYAGRAELFGPNYSLILKNVQHNDSGDYTAVVIGEKQKRVAEYEVIVQDPVTPAKLTVESVSKSSDSCNLTVTCSTVDFNISSSFRCDGKNCSHAEEKDLKATKNFSSLIVYLQQDTIFCNHSNQVSWNVTKKVLRSFCETETVPSGAIIIAASTSVLFLLTLFITLCFIMKCKSKGGNQENTIYAVPEDITPGQTQNQTPSGHESCNSPTSTYALVEFHTAQKSTKTENIPQPETVYAQVDRAAKPNSTVQQQTPKPEENQ